MSLKNGLTPLILTLREVVKWLPVTDSDGIFREMEHDKGDLESR